MTTYTDRDTRIEGAKFISTEHYDAKNYDYTTVYRLYIMRNADWKLLGTYKTYSQAERAAYLML